MNIYKNTPEVRAFLRERQRKYRERKKRKALEGKAGQPSPTKTPDSTPLRGEPIDKEIQVTV